jgi:hypothetical protein
VNILFAIFLVPSVVPALTRSALLFLFLDLILTAYIFLTVDGVTSTGAHVMVGNGLPPPVADQGVKL